MNARRDVFSRFGNGDGRETECLAYVRANATEGDPLSVLATMDKFAKSINWMMNIGDVKGDILKQSLRRAQPHTVLELGAYCGYSAILIASTIASANTGGDNDGNNGVSRPHVYTIEVNAAYAQITREMAAFAGLGRDIAVINGSLSHPETLKTVVNLFGQRGIEYLFIDHWKDAYLPDLRTVLQHNLLRRGSVVLADNCGTPGAPDYVAFVESNSVTVAAEEKRRALFRSTRFVTQLEYADSLPDMVLESVYIGGGD